MTIISNCSLFGLTVFAVGAFSAGLNADQTAPASTGDRSVNSTASGVAVSAAGAASAATESAPTAQLEQVVVTAQKRDEYVNSVPQSISTFRGEDLRQAGITDTRDLGKLVPGFTVADSGFDVPIYTLRGVGFADSSFSATSTVGVYNDEVSLTYPVMSKGQNFDLRRVEVVQGPQGTLYGRNSTGGTINYIANKPTGSFATGADVTYGSFGRVDADGYVSGPISDSVRARFAASSITSQEGWQISNTRPDDRLGKLNKQAARGIVDWQVLDDLQLRFTLSGWTDKSQPEAPFAIALQPQNPFFGQAGLDPSVRNYPIIPNNKNPQIADWNPNRDFGLHDNFWLGSLRPQWNIDDDTSLTGIFSYEQVRSDGSVLPQGGLDVDDINDQINAFIRSASAEIRLAGKFGDSADWLIGINGNYDKQHEVVLGLASENSLNILQFGDTPPLDKPIFFEKGGAKSDVQVHSGSVFADGNWEFLDHLKLTLGARYTEEAQSYAGCTFIAADNNSIIPFPYFTIASLIRQGLPLPTAGDLSSLQNLRDYLSSLNPVVRQGDCGSIGSDGKAGLFTSTLNEHNFSYRSVLSWTPLKDTLLYGSYSRGYKAGGFPTVFSVDQQSLAPVVQEKLDAYEIGSKVTTLGGALHIDLAGFYYDYTNKQLLTYFKDPIFGALQYLQNVPKSLDEGVQLSTTFIPIDKLFLTATGSYIRTKVIEYQGLTSQGAPFDFAGQSFNYTPRLQATFIANYTFELNADLNISPGASFTYSGGTNATLEHDPLFELNAHRVVDVRLGLSPHFGKWKLEAFGRNIGNEFYRTSVVKLGDSVFGYAGMTRVYGLNFSCDFR